MRTTHQFIYQHQQDENPLDAAKKAAEAGALATPEASIEAPDLEVEAVEKDTEDAAMAVEDAAENATTTDFIPFTDDVEVKEAREFPTVSELVQVVPGLGFLIAGIVTENPMLAAKGAKTLAETGFKDPKLPKKLAHLTKHLNPMWLAGNYVVSPAAKWALEATVGAKVDENGNVLEPGRVDPETIDTISRWLSFHLRATGEWTDVVASGYEMALVKANEVLTPELKDQIAEVTATAQGLQARYNKLDPASRTMIEAYLKHMLFEAVDEGNAPNLKDFTDVVGVIVESEAITPEKVAQTVGDYAAKQGVKSAEAVSFIKDLVDIATALRK